MWPIIVENLGGPVLEWLLGRCFTKKPFLALGKWKMIFYANKIKTPQINIVSHAKMHTCVQYGVILTNYAMVVVMT